MHILVVEDSAATRHLLDLLLQTAGYRVDMAEDGAGAIAAAELHRYDLVLMDLGLPDLDGYAACRALRQTASGRARTPVVALTARTGFEEADRCRGAGLDGYLTKPFQATKLVREVRRWTSPRAMPAPQEDGAPVWDRAIYREIADRLGPTRVETALDLFEAHLLRSLTVIRSAPDDAAMLARETHSLVASAGMLGFAELSRVCREITTPAGVRSGLPAALALEDAVERVLDCLRHAPHSALA